MYVIGGSRKEDMQTIIQIERASMISRSSTQFTESLCVAPRIDGPAKRGNRCEGAEG